MRRLLLLLAVLAVAAPAPAGAATRFEIIDDCSDDSRLSGTYTVAELRDARRNLRTEVAEYTDCADVLRRAELALMERGGKGTSAAPAGGTGAGGEPAGAAPLVPAGDAEQAALRDARSQAGAAPVRVRGREIRPGSAGFTNAAVHNEMPGSLLPVVISLALLCAGLLVAGVRKFALRGTGEAMGDDLWRPIP